MTIEQEMPSSLTDPNRKASQAGVLRAATKIAKILPPTPLLPLEIDGRTIWCKAESLQPTGAFKIRGAWHRLTDMNEDERAKGVVAFSSGNHAQAIAWSAKRLGMKATIVMPDDAPSTKIHKTSTLGAQIVTYDRMKESREKIAANISKDTGALLVPSFDDPWIIEGQGSAMIEVAAQLLAFGLGPIGHIIACCGGGGLAGGSKLAAPDARITLVEPEGWDDMGVSLRAGYIIPIGENPPKTGCDALQTLRISERSFEILRDADATSVSEVEMENAMRLAYDKLRVVVEPGGAVALAAVLSGKVDLSFDTQNIVVTLSGGNVDKDYYTKVIRGNK